MSKDNANSIQNDTSENQDDLNDSEMLEIGGFIHGGKIRRLKYDNNHVLSNKGANFQGKFLKTLLIKRQLIYIFFSFSLDTSP